MNCPICGADTRVLRTDSARRRRECVRCHHRVTTVEIDEASHHKTQTIIERAKALAHDLISEQP